MQKVESLNLQTDTPEGEIFIQDFLKQIGIKYVFQPKIPKLKNDEPSFRIADFYLSEYDVYIELLGKWKKGTPKDDENIIKKKIAYEENDIACVYLYYENLGYLYHALDQRLIKCLKKHKKEKELRKYRLFKFRKTATPNVLAFLISSLLIPVVVFTNESVDTSALTILSCILIYQAYRIYHLYNLIFRKDRFSLFNQYIDK